MKKIILVLSLILATTQCFAQSERILADTRLRSSSVNVLKRFGDPNEIYVNTLYGSSNPIITSFGKINSTVGIQDQITWIYNYKNYKLKFTLNDYSSVGAVAIEGSLSPYKTSKNIKLGSFYSDVIKAYGMPNHEYENDDIIKLVYTNNNLIFVVQKSNDKFKSSFKINKIELNSIEN